MIDLEKQVARLQTLARLNQLVSSSLDIDRILSEIASAAAELTDAQIVSLWVADESAQTLELRAFSDEAMGASHPQRRLRFGEGGVGWVALHRRPLAIPDLLSDTRLANRPWLQAQGLRSVFAVPIIDRDSLLGVIAMLGREPFAFESDDRDLLDSFVAQAATAIRNARLFAESESRRRSAEALAQLSRLCSETLDLATVVQRVVESVRTLLGVSVAALYRLVPETGDLVTLARAGTDSRTLGPSAVFPRGTGAVGLAVQQRRAVFSENFLTDSRITFAPAISERLQGVAYRAVLALPLLVKERVIGALAVCAGEGRVFSDDETRLAQAFADQAALVLENAQLFEDTARRRREAEVLAEVVGHISGSLDLATILERIVRGAQELAGADGALIALREPDTDAFRILHQRGIGDEVGAGPSISSGKGAGGLVLATGRPFRTANYLEDPRITGDYVDRVRAAGIVSEMIVPIKNGEVKGLLYVFNRTPRPFTDRDEAALGRLADHAAIAIGNARLFEENERRRREAEVLAELAGQINASLDLETVLERVSVAAKGLCDADLSRIALRRPGSEAIVLQYASGALHGPYEGTRIEPGKGIGGQVLLTGRPFRTDNYAEDPLITKDFLDLARAEGIVTALVVPVQTEERIEGLLYAENRSSRPFTARDETTLLRLAQQAAIAIKNGQLLQALRTHQVRLEALFDVSCQIAQIQPVESLLEVIARACGQVLDSNSVGFRLVEGDELVITGTWGDAREAMLAPRLKIGESVSGLVAATGVPLVLEDATEDPRVLPAHREALVRLGYRSWLGVPVKLGERLVGVLSIRTRREGGFSKEDQAIAAAFAAQAATALENSRLFQEVQQACTELSRARDDLTQAQKMDAIGRLAGGVAHDFNNLLTIVHGRSEILLRRLGADPKSRRDVELIQHTTLRAAALTRQLLAFSRKQVLQPKVLSLNSAVTDSAAMFRRLIGEDINLVVVPGAGLDRVKADPTQLEQILINLAINARDAMPQGGRLVIETANVDLGDAFVSGHLGSRPGPHVMLSVSDSGGGMSPEVQARAFEPFFTTKEKSNGTGLGLATVYGIVKQHDGYIELKSALGEGTTVSIYLPRVEEPAAVAEPERAPAAAPGGSETILLVEDEDEVRELAREILEASGYTVIDAGSGAEALRVCRQHPDRVHLLLTDVVMPGMSGRELARQVATLRPETKVVYTSGYTDDALGHHGVLEPGIILLEKPFTPDSLLEAVRSALD